MQSPLRYPRRTRFAPKSAGNARDYSTHTNADPPFRNRGFLHIDRRTRGHPHLARLGGDPARVCRAGIGQAAASFGRGSSGVRRPPWCGRSVRQAAGP